MILYFLESFFFTKFVIDEILEDDFPNGLFVIWMNTQNDMQMRSFIFVKMNFLHP
ncbi:hypothetical protein ACFFGI_01000 [Gluconobacter japonicus]|uniref:hypothetical protein n=1 Tax=Gluconobacter japonicus TaxID=376620 RepID=UPI001428A558|nr:hypothetical protein [Gluconobacter japonicus]